jgi:hypothetical protein
VKVFNDGSLVFGKPYTYTIAVANPLVDGATFTIVPGNFAAFASPPTVTFSGNNLVLSFTPVPEPAAALGAGALAAAGRAGLWRRRAAAAKAA